jgi:hypothetical protein
VFSLRPQRVLSVPPTGIVRAPRTSRPFLLRRYKN